MEFHLPSLHQPQEGKGGSAFHLASGVGWGRGHLIGRQAQDVLCQSQVYSKALSAIIAPTYMCSGCPGQH